MLIVPRGFQGDANAFPYSVEMTGDRPGITRLEEGRFHVWRTGALGTFLPTASAILVTRDFAKVLAEETTIGWRIREVTILDPPSGEVLGYVELAVDAELTPDSLPPNVSGKQVWRFGPNHLFVSPDLAKALEMRFPDLSFSLGFSRFAG